MGWFSRSQFILNGFLIKFCYILFQITLSIVWSRIRLTGNLWSMAQDNRSVNMKQLVVNCFRFVVSLHLSEHSRPQRPRSFWSAPKITTSGQVQHRKSAIHGLPVTLRMLRVKSDKCDWFWSQSIVFTKPFKTGMSLDRARGRDFWCWPKGARPLGTRMLSELKLVISLCLIPRPYRAVFNWVSNVMRQSVLVLVLLRFEIGWVVWLVNNWFGFDFTTLNWKPFC